MKEVFDQMSTGTLLGAWQKNLFVGRFGLFAESVSLEIFLENSLKRILLTKPLFLPPLLAGLFLKSFFFRRAPFFVDVFSV